MPIHRPPLLWPEKDRMPMLSTQPSGSVPDRAAPLFPAIAGELQIHDSTDARRRAVEQCIQHIYAQHYGARVPSFAPMLVALQQDEEVVAAAGYRPAAEGPLFLESYLPAPVDRLIGDQTGTRLSRQRIVEVGHLAATRGGEGRRLLQLLGLHLAQEGFEWIVGTVTQELRALLVRLGVAPLTLGAAHPEALGDTALCWGSYYQHAPIVLAIHLSRAVRQHRVRQLRAQLRGLR